MGVVMGDEGSFEAGAGKAAEIRGETGGGGVVTDGDGGEDIWDGGVYDGATTEKGGAARGEEKVFIVGGCEIARGFRIGGKLVSEVEPNRAWLMVEGAEASAAAAVTSIGAACREMSEAGQVGESRARGELLGSGCDRDGIAARSGENASGEALGKQRTRPAQERPE